MPRYLLAAATICLLTVAAAADTPPAGKAIQRSVSPTPQQIDALRLKLTRVFGSSVLPDQDENTFVTSLEQILSDPAFLSLRPNEQHAAYLLLAAVYYDVKRFSDGLTVIRKACEFGDAGAQDWGLRVQLASSARDLADATKSLTRVVLLWPEKLKNFNDSWIRSLVETTNGRSDAASASALREALFGASWHPDDVLDRIDFIWLELTLDRLERGDIKGAQESVARVELASALIQINTDKRFDTLTKPSPDRFDVRSAAERNLSDAKRLSASVPRRLEGVTRVAESMLALGYAKDALRLLDAALARSASAYDDYDEQINWVMDIRSRALFDLGRSDEALDALKQGAQHKENGFINVSQSINLADNYNLLGRANEAIEAVKALDFKNASPYGRMALEDARACAYYLLGDSKNLNEALAYMRMYADDGVSNYINTLLFTGDAEGLARELIRELADPAQRAHALNVLQNYLPASHPSARQVQMHATLLDVRSRPDLRATLAKIGRIASFPVHSPGY